MHQITRTAILRDWKDGYKIWRICRDRKVTRHQVADVLAAKYGLHGIEMRLKKRGFYEEGKA